MRIGLITPGFSASEQDWCIPALLDLVRCLARDHDTTVFALRYPHTRAPYEVFGAKVIPLGAAERRGPGRLFMAWRARQAILQVAREQRFDILHALWAHEPGALATALGTRLATPTLVSLLGGELVDEPSLNYGGARGFLNRRLIRRSLTRASHVTAPTSEVMRAASDIVDASRLSELPLGVDTTRFRPGLASGEPHPKLDGGPVVLQVGSLVPIKDHATLLAAFATLLTRLPRARLHLVGEGPLRSQLEGQAPALGIDHAIRFHGAIEHDRLPDFYRRADLVTISSRFESQCMALLEAAACGRTLAGTAVGVLPSLVPDAHCAPPGDPARLAEAMHRALDDHTGTSETEAEARARDVALRFGLDVTVPRLVALYRALVDRAHSDQRGGRRSSSMMSDSTVHSSSTPLPNGE